MTVEAPERLNTSNFKKLEVLVNPDLGGRREPNPQPDSLIAIVKSSDRFPAPERPQKREISPYLPKNSPLERAGFLLYRQVENFIEEVSSGRFEEAVVELITEIRAHANEYTKEAPLLTGNIKRAETGIVNSYNNEPVINHLDWKEREGATARGSVDFNSKVLEAGQGDCVVLVSPSGWNGVYEDYEKTQIVFARVKKGEALDQLTFVLKFGFENCVSVLEKMGVSRADLVCSDRKEAIKKMASQAMVLGSGQEISHPRGFLNLLKQVNPNDSSLKIIERDLDRFLKGEDIAVLAPVCENYLDSLRTFLSSNKSKLGDFNFQAEISDRVEETIYKIAEYIRGIGFKTPSVILRAKPEGSNYILRHAQNDREGNWRDKYGDIIGVLQQISGCAGGGSRISSSIRALGGIFSVGLFGSRIEGKLNKDCCSKCGRMGAELECGVCGNCATE